MIDGYKNGVLLDKVHMSGALMEEYMRVIAGTARRLLLKKIGRAHV